MPEPGRKITCYHSEKHKKYHWEAQPFSETLNSEYEYCFCDLCSKQEYTEVYRFVPVPKQVLIWKKENNMEDGKLSVSKALKNRWRKEGKKPKLSLREFARRLAKAGDKPAADWFANKAGACNEDRLQKNKDRAASERSATHTSRRKKSPKSEPATK